MVEKEIGEESIWWKRGVIINASDEYHEVLLLPLSAQKRNRNKLTVRRQSNCGRSRNKDDSSNRGPDLRPLEQCHSLREYHLYNNSILRNNGILQGIAYSRRQTQTTLSRNHPTYSNIPPRANWRLLLSLVGSAVHAHDLPLFRYL